MSDTTECTSIISENAARDILDQIEAVRALVFALITALECPLYTDYEDENATVKGSGFFVADEKAILKIFGEKLHDEFVTMARNVTKLKMISDLK